MATGKQARDIFARTTKPAKIGLDVTPRIKGRPRAAEPYQKVTVCLFDRQVLLLDKIALAIREKTGQHVRRAELVRAIVDQAAGTLKADGKDFDKAVRSLLPRLGGGTR
jgi:hypothetical protein